VVKQGYVELQNRQSARAHDVARMATPGRVGMPPCRRTRTPRQACACWVEHRVLVPVHDACGSPGRCHVLLAHRPRRAAHAPSLADGRTRVAAPSAVLRPCHGPRLDWPQLGAQANTSTASSQPYKPSFSTRVSTQPAAVRHRCRSGELHLRLPFFANA
jgi:hypothetical protein